VSRSNDTERAAQTSALRRNPCKRSERKETLMIPEASVPDVPNVSSLHRLHLPVPKLADPGPASNISEWISRRAALGAQPAVRVAADLCRCGIALILSLGGYDEADL
jgi:hypothetical protein